MKKILLGFFKQVELKNQTQLIIELLTLNKTPEESLQLFESVNTKFQAEMILKREKMRKTVKLLDDNFQDIKVKKIDVVKFETV